MHFLSPSSKNKETHPEKNSLYFEKWNLLTLILRNSLYFLKRKLFLYFRKWKPHKNFLYYRKENFLMFWKTETPRKFFTFQATENLKNLYLQKRTFRARKKRPIFKKFLIFWAFLKINLYSLHHNILHQNYYKRFICLNKIIFF